MSELPALIQALLDPSSYPHHPRQVGLEQTQISFVFLTGDYVYKVKKPVDFGFLDFTALERRRFFCQQEVGLNRRLCPEVYLGVVDIVPQGRGFRVEAQGEAVEYAVKMRQLPRERMLDRLLKKGEASAPMMQRLARRIADFHQEAQVAPPGFGDRGTVLENTQENWAQTEPYIGRSLTPKQYREIRAWSDRFLEERASLFDRRFQEGRARDCHGDLHAAHICFQDGICIFDCIEFNDRFRYTDVANEVAFLAMDLDRHRRPDLSRAFVDSYVELSGDRELGELLDFYKCYRAYVRGKVEGFKLDDPLIPEGEKARVLAVVKRYFQLAESYILKDERRSSNSC